MIYDHKICFFVPKRWDFVEILGRVHIEFRIY